MTGTAADHTGEAANTLRLAATIADPYQRADAIWEAVLRLRRASGCLGGLAARRCGEISRHLEEGCEASGTLPDAEAPKHYARCLAGPQIEEP
jgi:hypothetical protein